MNNEVNKRLEELKIEDFIWIIYIAIIFLSWMSNHLERRYFKYKDQVAKENYRKITSIIFIILIVVYIYFFIESINDLRNLKESDSNKKKFLVYLSFIASLLILISGLIFLYISLNDDDLSVEIAFN